MIAPLTQRLAATRGTYPTADRATVAFSSRVARRTNTSANTVTSQASRPVAVRRFAQADVRSKASGFWAPVSASETVARY
jgi:hypothetical protein